MWNWDKQTLNDLVEASVSLSEFHADLVFFLKSLAKPPIKSLEIGCGTGITSLKMDGYDRTLLDLDACAISNATALFAYFQQRADFIVGDMFSLPFPDDCFDLCFSSGVIEHFSKQQRKEALVEMTRVTKPGGNIVVAIPNHFSLPYRIAYLLRYLMGRWPYPKEERIYDLDFEVRELPIDKVCRVTRSLDTAIDYLPTRVLRSLFGHLNRWFDYEGYLTILHYTKRQ